MTAKRDLKRHIRDRQAKTGESYTAARRHVIAAQTPPAAPTTPISVDALVDITEAATTVGLRCKVRMSEELAATISPARMLIALRDVLLATLRDPETDFLRGLVLYGDVGTAPAVRVRDLRQAQFVERVRAGFGGTSPDGRALGFHVDGVAIICTAWRREPTLVVCALDDALLRVLSGLGPLSARPLLAPILEFGGTRYPMVKPMFVIGRHRTCDLAIRDGRISRRHAMVMRTTTGWRIKDLESTSGVFYKGMQIDNKGIEEGDVFLVGPYELRFTFRR